MKIQDAYPAIHVVNVHLVHNKLQLKFSLPPSLPQSLAGIRQLQDTPTATYCVVLDGSGETYCAVGDMDILQSISPEWVSVIPGWPKLAVRSSCHRNR